MGHSMDTHIGQLMLRKSLEGKVQVCVCARVCVSLLYTLLMPCLLAISLSSEIACTSPTATATAVAAAALSATCLPQVAKLLLLLRFMANAHRSTLRTVFHGHHHPQHAAHFILQLFYWFSCFLFAAAAAAIIMLCNGNHKHAECIPLGHGTHSHTHLQRLVLPVCSLGKFLRFRL